MLSFAYNSTASSLLTTLQSREGTNKPQLVIITSNAAPTVSLQAPTSSDNFTAPATFSIIASAADSDGNIQKVEFYNGAALLGSATQSPYLYDWLNVAAGSYTLTAKAFDNANASTISAPVNITVNAPQVAAGIYYIFADHLNTARVITDQANKTVWRWESDPFGTSAPFEDPDGDGVKFGYNLRFPGQYFDAESGLHQNYFRDYDPSTGRYVQSDPIGLAGGLNTFGYANQNPLSFTDPLGLAPKNDPQRRPKTEHEVDLGDLPEATGGILCALGIGACLPPNLFRCTKMRCTPPQCGGTPYFLDYRLPGHQLVDPNASCECVDKGFNPNFRGNIPGL